MTGVPRNPCILGRIPSPSLFLADFPLYLTIHTLSLDPDSDPRPQHTERARKLPLSSTYAYRLRRANRACLDSGFGDWKRLARRNLLLAINIMRTQPPQ